MNGKKIIGLFLLISLHLHCMLTVKPVRRGNGGKIPRVLKTDSATPSVKKYIEEIKENEKCIAIENYGHNKHNFFVLNGDIFTQVVTHLDHLSNIQLIRSSKHLYEKYRRQAPDATIIYSNCLFTKLPFPFEAHTRAMFHYAVFNKKQAEMLLEIEDTDGSRLALLKKFSIDISDHNAVVNFYQQNFSLAHICYMLQDPTLLHVMLKRGVSPNAADEKGRTLLMYSIVKDNALELLDILLKDPHIDINAKDNNDNTMLMHALARKNAVELLDVLLKHPRIDINAKDNNGNTVLMCALARENAAEILNVLLKHPRIDINAKNNNGNTALLWALATKNAVELLNVLLKHPNLDINAEDNGGSTAGDYAIRMGNPDILIALLNNVRTEIAVASIGYWYNMVSMFRKNPEITRLLSQRTSFSTKIEFPAIVCMFMAGLYVIP